MYIVFPRFNTNSGGRAVESQANQALSHGTCQAPRSTPLRGIRRTCETFGAKGDSLMIPLSCRRQKKQKTYDCKLAVDWCTDSSCERVREKANRAA